MKKMQILQIIFGLALLIISSFLIDREWENRQCKKEISPVNIPINMIEGVLYPINSNLHLTSNQTMTLVEVNGHTYFTTVEGSEFFK